ncbi:hypothetical protein [Salinimonas chungwhensis]|uniref:hypothetical protein n=1 Tax=Salinimonas chungwhensis TaxID=265425 RepID=UPI00035D5B99|nr:hypothetical protein [Salinimonas chungwhensis]
MNEEQQLEFSELSQEISSAGQTVKVEIYRMEGESGWLLEVVDEFNNSTVWDDPFESDEKALLEVKKTILEEGILSLIGPDLSPKN